MQHHFINNFWDGLLVKMYFEKTDNGDDDLHKDRTLSKEQRRSKLSNNREKFDREKKIRLSPKGRRNNRKFYEEDYENE